MDGLDPLLSGWEDPDRRDAALERVLAAVSVHQPKFGLSSAEQRVLRCLAAGLTRQEAADLLGVTYYTVEKQSMSAMRKLAAKNRTQACCEAIRQGLIP